MNIKSILKNKYFIILIFAILLIIIWNSYKYIESVTKITVDAGKNSFISQVSPLVKGQYIIFRSGNVLYEAGSMKGDISIYKENGELIKNQIIDNIGSVRLSSKDKTGAYFYSDYANLGVNVDNSGKIINDSKYFEGYPKNLIGPSPENIHSTDKWRVVYYNIGSLDSNLQVAFKFVNLDTKVEKELRLTNASSAANFGIIDDKLIYIWNDSKNWGSGNDPIYMGIYNMNSQNLKTRKFH